MRPSAFISCLTLLLMVWALGGCGTAAPSASVGGLETDGSGALDGTVETATTTFTPTTLTPSTVLTTTTLSRTESVRAEMTLRQKAAQVLLLGFEGTELLPSTVDLLEYGPPGGLLLLGYNVTGAGQLRSLTTALQKAAISMDPALGLFIAVDQEGGPVQRIRDGVPTLPSPREVGESLTSAEAERLAAETAAALLDLGVNMNLAPVADVVSDPGSFLYDRTFGGDPELVSEMVAAVTGAFVESGLIAVVKHFPGHGSISGDPHDQSVVTDADEGAFAAVHLPPFRAALAVGAECVMTAHLVATAYDPDQPATLSAPVIEELLRGGLGFSGVVVSDDLEMAAVAAAGLGTTGETSDIGEIAVSALRAGCDLLISTGTLNRQKTMIDAIERAVLTGTLAEGRLDQAVLRILDLKLRHGIAAVRIP